MIITCPYSNTPNEIDEHSISPDAKLAECNTCNQKFTVNPNESLDDITCPKCGHKEKRRDECTKCGVVFAKIGPTTPIGAATNNTIMNNKILIGVVALCACGLLALFFFAGRGSIPKTKIEVTEQTSNSVKDDLDESFGWGKAPKDIQVEAVDIIKGIYHKDYGKYTLPIPAIKFALKNNSGNNMASFGISYSFVDLDNKRKIGTYTIASGPIKAGWSSERQFFHIQPGKVAELVGNNSRISFRVKFTAWAKTVVGPKQLYDTVFEPSELDQLPMIDWNSGPVASKINTLPIKGGSSGK